MLCSRKSAAKSKEKQRREATSSKIQHDTRLSQLGAMSFESQIHDHYTRSHNFPDKSQTEVSAAKRSYIDPEPQAWPITSVTARFCCSSAGHVLHIYGDVSICAQCAMQQQYQCS